MLNAEKILEMLSCKEYVKIADLCKAEIAKSANKSTRGASFAKVVSRFEKWAGKDYFKNGVEMFLPSVCEIDGLGGEKMLWAVDNGDTFAILLKNPDEIKINLPIKPKEDAMNVNAVFPQGWEKWENIKVSAAEFKKVVKNIPIVCKPFEYKTRDVKSKNVLVKYNNTFFDSGLLAKVFDILGDGKLYLNTNVLAPNVYESDFGYAIIMPVRAPKDDAFVKTYDEYKGIVFNQAEQF